MATQYKRTHAHEDLREAILAYPTNGGLSAAYHRPTGLQDCGIGGPSLLEILTALLQAGKWLTRGRTQRARLGALISRGLVCLQRALTSMREVLPQSYTWCGEPIVELGATESPLPQAHGRFSQIANLDHT